MSAAPPSSNGGATVKRPWLALVALCLSVVLVSMDNMIVNVALPTIGKDLVASTRDLQWIVDGYTTAFAALLLVGGYLGDRFGHRLLLGIGLGGFVLASWAATQLDTVGGLVVARALMGTCAAMLYPCTLALLTRIFAGPKLPMAIGIWSGVSGAGIALGPVLGGLLLEWFHWSSIFWVNVPVALAGLLLVAVALPGGGSDHRVGKLDVLGSIVSALFVAILVYGIIEAPTYGWRSQRSLLTFALSVTLLAAFVVIERQVRHPLIDLTLLRKPTVSVAAGCIAIAHLALFGFIFLITMYFQLVKGWGTLEAGVATLPYAAVMAVLSPTAMLIARKLGDRLVIVSGMLLMGGGLAIATLAQPSSQYMPVIVASMVVMASGMGLSVGPATALVMGAMPRGFAGVGSGINDTTREVGGALGVAVVGSVLSSLFGPRIADSFAAYHLPDVVMSAAQSSLGGALAVSDALPPAVAHTARESALQAFTSSMHGATWVAVGATILSAVMAVLWLPGRARGKH